MNVKEFLLSLDFEQLWLRHYKDFFENNEMMIAKAKKENYNLYERIRINFEHFMNQIKDIDIETSETEYMIVMKYQDFDYTDDVDTVITESFDPFLLDKSECKNHGKLFPISSLKEAFKEPIWANYSLMFISWERILGMEICYLPDDIYGAASAIIDELTFFGFDKTSNDESVKEETAKLDKIQKEIETGTAEFVEFNSELFAEELGLPKETPEQKEKIRKLNEKLMINNYNEKIRVYNILLEQGFFDNCEGT